PELARHSNRETWLFAIILAVLLGGAAAAGYSYYRTRIQSQKSEAEVKADEAKSAKPQPPEAANAATTPTTLPASSTGPDSNQPAPEVTETAADGKLPEASTFGARRQLGPRAAVTAPSEVSFSSRPDAARVQIDGATDRSWTTPFRSRHLAPGTHSVVFS